MEKLKRLREKRGLSQVKLAARADLNPATVNQIERGARDASPGTLRKLADALEVSLYELMEEEAPKAPGPAQLELEQSGADEDVVQRYSQVPGAIDDLMRQQAEARARELDDPNSPWFSSLHIASLWLETVSDEASRFRRWVEKYASILQPPSKVLSNRHEFLRHNIQLVSHAGMTYSQIYRKAKRRIEAMDERPDDLARRRVEKADADMQENERRLHELQEAASS